MQLAVIAKEPVPGRVKTRLCPPFTPTEAAELAAAALADTLLVVGSTPASARTVVLDGSPGPWLPPGYEVIAQRGTGLDERLAAAFEDCGARRSDPVVLVGMDTPQLAARSLLRAGSWLRAPRGERRAVLGPALDGGYWLIGLSEANREVFEGIAMSESTTGSAQLDRLHDLGFDVALLEVLRDVDTAVDAEAVARLVPAGAFAAVFQRVAPAAR